MATRVSFIVREAKISVDRCDQAGRRSTLANADTSAGHCTAIVERRPALNFMETSYRQQSSKGIVMSTNTIRLHRVLRATPERVYRAFLDADAMVKWLPPNGFTGKVHHLDARVGGTYKMSFTNFTSGNSHSFGGEYLELVPNERIRHADRFDDPNLPGEMQTTVSLKQVSVGT